MKKKAFTLCVLLAVFAVLFISCFSCGGAEVNTATELTAETEAVAEGGEATVETGDVSTGDITAGSQSVETIVEAPYTFAELIRDIYKDTFTRIVLSIMIVLWATGNLNPGRGFFLFDKTEGK